MKKAALFAAAVIALSSVSMTVYADQENNADTSGAGETVPFYDAYEEETNTDGDPESSEEAPAADETADPEGTSGNEVSPSEENEEDITFEEGEKNKAEGYATFGEFFKDKYKSEELEYVSAIKNGVPFNITIAPDTILAELGLEDEEYYFVWFVSGKRVVVELIVEDGKFIFLYKGLEEITPVTTIIDQSNNNGSAATITFSNGRAESSFKPAAVKYTNDGGSKETASKQDSSKENQTTNTGTAVNNTTTPAPAAPAAEKNVSGNTDNNANNNSPANGSTDNPATGSKNGAAYLIAAVSMTAAAAAVKKRSNRS